MTRILHLDTPVRGTASASRAASAAIVARLRRENPGATVVTRDLAEGVPGLTRAWTEANFTPAEDRTAAQRDALALSESLIREIEQADVLVIGLALYNFGVPAGLKTWIDQVSRARRTFRYTADGPEGLLTGKRAIVAYASGGTPLGGAKDFATPWLAHVLGFIGIEDVAFETAADVIEQAA